MGVLPAASISDRKSTRLNSSHTVIYTLSLHDALPICLFDVHIHLRRADEVTELVSDLDLQLHGRLTRRVDLRSEEHTSELQSHSDLHSFPTRRSSDLLV